MSDASTMDPLAFARQIYPKDEQFWYLRYHNYDYLAEIGRAEDEYDADPGLMFRCEHSKVALACSTMLSVSVCRKMMGGPSASKVPFEQVQWEAAAPAREHGGKLLAIWVCLFKIARYACGQGASPPRATTTGTPAGSLASL